MSGYIGNIPTPQATQTRDVFTATAGQTSFATSGYTPGFLDVYLNGVHLVNGTDYTASNGSDVVLTSGATAGDNVEVVAYTTFEVVDQSFSGNFSVDSPTFVVDAANNRVGVGTSSPATTLHVIGSARVGMQSGASVDLGQNENGGEIGLNNSSNAQRGLIDFVDGNNDGNGTLRFLNLSPTDGDVLIGIAAANAAGNVLFVTNNNERMRLDPSGNLLVGRTTNLAGNWSHNIQSTGGSGAWPLGIISTDRGLIVRQTAVGNGFMSYFEVGSGTAIGSISNTATSVAYNTTSDYRLKENVVPLSGAADRLAQIPVHRFNFIADPDRTVDGFLAHEVQDIVPECVTGTKDQVETVEVTDEDGNVTTETRPVYQGIDQSKLVPLLTAALQEALADIATLKAEVAALKGEPA